MMKNKPHAIILAALLLCVGFNTNYFAQQTNTPAARKVDEFGDIQYSDLIARLDAFAIQLQNDPTARGFIIAYRSHRDLPGLSSRLAERTLPYLIYSRGIDAKRITAVDGGAASCLVQEIWIVPPGTVPKIRDDAYQQYFTDTEAVRKFDEYYYSPFKIAIEGEGGEGDSLGAFAAALRPEPRAQAYVIVYPQYYINSDRHVEIDSQTRARNIMGAMRRELVNKHKIAASRVTVINGGYRRATQIELWIVPRGEHAPIATPNAFPRSRTRR